MTQTIDEQLRGVWQRTDRIFATLRPEAFLARPIALRHPFIFYVGHLPAFAWIHICGGTLGRPSPAPLFEDMFSRGIDPDVDDPARCHDHPEVPERWPDVSAVLAYRDRVRAEIVESIDAVAARSDTDVMAENGRVLAMVVEHEMMHQETLLYMVQQLAPELKTRPSWLPRVRVRGSRSAAPGDHPRGRATLGADFETCLSAGTTSSPRCRWRWPVSRSTRCRCATREFLEFVESGAYGRSEMWREEDWAWKAQAGLAIRSSGSAGAATWFQQTAFDLLPLREVEGWPAYVSLAEARAYARWRGGRLPTEAEFHRAAYGQPDGRERAFPWPDDTPAPSAATSISSAGRPMPVGSRPAAPAPGVSTSWWATAGNGPTRRSTGFPGFKAYIERYPATRPTSSTASTTS